MNPLVSRPYEGCAEVEFCCTNCGSDKIPVVEQTVPIDWESVAILEGLGFEHSRYFYPVFACFCSECNHPQGWINR